MGKAPRKFLVEHAQRVESPGFDQLWVPDHHVNPGDKEMDWFDFHQINGSLSELLQ